MVNETPAQYGTSSDTREYAFEFDARIIASSSMQWEKTKDRNGQTLPAPVRMYVNKYSFTSDRINGTLVEWLDGPRDPLLKSGKCKIRFRQMKPSSQMFGFYELSGYPIL